MGRLEDILTLEAAGQLPDSMKSDLATLRAAGHVPPLDNSIAEPTPAADMNISAAPQPKKGLMQYIGDEAKAGLKEMSSPSTAQFPGSEAIANFSPTARNVSARFWVRVGRLMQYLRALRRSTSLNH